MAISDNNVEVLRADLMPSYKTAAAVTQGLNVFMSTTNDVVTAMSSTTVGKRFGMASVLATASGAESIPILRKGKIRVDLSVTAVFSGTAGSCAAAGLFYVDTNGKFSESSSGTSQVGVITATDASTYAEVEVDYTNPSA